MQLRKLHSHPAAQGRSPLFAGLPQCSWSSARASARPAPPPRVAFMEPCTSDHNSSSSRRAAAEQALVAAWSTLCAEQEPAPARGAQQEDERQERRLAWHEKTMHEWALVEDAAHLVSLTSPAPEAEAAQDGIIVVEFFSPACLACKGAAPALSKLPQVTTSRGGGAFRRTPPRFPAPKARRVLSVCTGGGSQGPARALAQGQHGGRELVLVRGVRWGGACRPHVRPGWRIRQAPALECVCDLHCRWLKRNGVTGLPHMSVFSARTGRRLVGMSCSNKKLPQVRVREARTGPLCVGECVHAVQATAVHSSTGADAGHGRGRALGAVARQRTHREETVGWQSEPRVVQGIKEGAGATQRATGPGRGTHAQSLCSTGWAGHPAGQGGVAGCGHDGQRTR